MKIKNEWQYRHAKAQARKFAEILAHFDERATRLPHSHAAATIHCGWKTTAGGGVFDSEIPDKIIGVVVLLKLRRYA
jgi:hypothetical protein